MIISKIIKSFQNISNMKYFVILGKIKSVNMQCAAKLAFSNIRRAFSYCNDLKITF